MTTSPTTGTIALVGSGEFLPPILPLDQKLLAHVQETPRAVVLPTAAAPDGAGVPERWAKMGIEHFGTLGTQVEAVMLLTREDAQNPELVERIAQANFVYFSGGKPRYLLEALRGTPAWEAITALYHSGGVVAGCSAGAMVMGAALFDFPKFWQTIPALSLAPGLMVIPHFDEIPRVMLASLNHKNQAVTVVGVDGSTGLVGHAGNWTVYGKGGVTVFEPEKRVRYTEGQQVKLLLPPLA
ncbi:MAG TPA: Type 1 glutamine amidotransferase-like domain-containing protein [Ktedonobacteraceae bacterium]